MSSRNLNLDGFSQSIGALSDAGTVDTSGSAAVTLTETDAGDTTFSGTLKGTSGVLSLVKDGDGRLYLAGANTYVGTTTIDDGFVTLGVGGTTGSLNAASKVSINSGGDLDFFQIDNFSFANALSGDGVLQKFLTNSVTLTNAANSFSGQIYVEDGSLVAGAAKAFGTAAIDVASGATLNLNGFSQSIGALSNSGTVDNSGATAATLVETNASTTEFDGVLENTGHALSLTKSGAGVLILTGANTYTGTTTISAGTLQIGNGGSTGTLGSVSGRHRQRRAGFRRRGRDLDRQGHRREAGPSSSRREPSRCSMTTPTRAERSSPGEP